MMTWLAIKAINFYQKFISPYKGFNCAHRVATGEVGCSGYGKKVIGRFGLVTGMKLLNRRFYDCSWHAKQLKKIREAEKENNYKIYRPVRGYKLAQGGFVDCDCGGCDAPSCNMPHCDLPSCDMPKLSNCVPDCSCSPGKALAAMDCLEILPDDCGDSKKRHPQAFQDKRNARNEGMCGSADDSIASNSGKGISLDKDDSDSDGGDGD